jgi:hypothetical protein
LTFGQVVKSSALDGGDMNEHILAATVLCDETVSRDGRVSTNTLFDFRRGMAFVSKPVRSNQPFGMIRPMLGAKILQEVRDELLGDLFCGASFSIGASESPCQL